MSLAAPEVLTPVLPVLPPLFDVVGTAVFALTGALVATQLRQTIVTVSFFALLTGVGGGTLRDLLIGAPPFWLHNPGIAFAVIGITLLTWFTPRRWWEGRVLEWADAAGLAVFSVLGTAKALDYGVHPMSAMILGIVSGCVGGIIRDVIAGVPSILMRPELYVTAAALSAAVAAVGMWADGPRNLVFLIAILAGFCLRVAAILWRIELPEYDRNENKKKAPPAD